MTTKENLAKTLGENVRKERKKRSITLNELSAKLEISTTYLGLIEMGKRGKNINIELLYRLAFVFDVSVDYLLGLSERENKPQDPEQETIMTLFKLMTDKERKQMIGLAQVLIK